MFYIPLELSKAIKEVAKLENKCHTTKSNESETQKNSVSITSKYHRQVPSKLIDVYDVLNAWQVTNPAIQHAIKKLLQPGKRGSKDKLTDLREAEKSIIRAIELES